MTSRGSCSRSRLCSPCIGVLVQLRNEKAELAHTLQQEQESLVNKLMRRIQKLESETNTKQAVPIDSSSLLLQ